MDKYMLHFSGETVSSTDPYAFARIYSLVGSLAHIYSPVGRLTNDW